MSEYVVRMPSDMPYEIKAELNAWYVEDGPIVRCRDCKMFDEHYLKCFRPVLYFDDDYMPHWTDETTFMAVTDATPDGFCAWGERKR